MIQVYYILFPKRIRAYTVSAFFRHGPDSLAHGKMKWSDHTAFFGAHSALRVFSAPIVKICSAAVHSAKHSSVCK